MDKHLLYSSFKVEAPTSTGPGRCKGRGPRICLVQRGVIRSSAETEDRKRHGERRGGKVA